MSRPMPGVVPAFDGMATAYDGQFTMSSIGRMMRSAVWARCAVRFAPGSRILEMNCGTGEDAMWLTRRGMHVLATDISPAMLQVAQDKAASSPGRALVRFQRLAWEELDSLAVEPFDGMLSNFGGLNCIADLRTAARALAAKLRSGAPAILCIMGPVVPWEWLWFLARGNPTQAFRRLRHGGVMWSGIQVHYPSILKTLRAFAPEFRPMRVSAIGTLLPPPYAEKLLTRWPRVIGALYRIERRFETRWPLPMLADHYLVEFERI